MVTLSKKYIKTLITLILLFPSIATAEFSIAGGQDIYKDKGGGYAEIRWRGTFSNNFSDRFGYSLYIGDMNTYGADLFLTWDRFMLGWGIETAAKSVDVVDSEGGYEILLEYAFTENWALSLKHRSNCRQLCRAIPGLDQLPKGEDDKTNGGFNWLMVRYSFK